MRGPLKPGTPAPRSGQYELIGPRGGHTGEERTVVRHEPLRRHQSPEWDTGSSIPQKTAPAENDVGAPYETRRSS